MRRRSNKLFEKAAMLVFCVFCLITLIILQLEKNDLRGEADRLDEQITALQAHQDELQATIDKPLDKAYIEEFAKKELGLRYPEEVIFYTNDNMD